MGEGTVVAQEEPGEATAARVAVPAPSHIIKRPRLTTILDETEARIILLCAPAGYGKTTLAREWVATRSERVLWYAGGPAMADVAALAVELSELFAQEESGDVERIRALASGSSSPRALARALAGIAPGEGCIVVLDDCHYASETPDADVLLSTLLSGTRFRVLLTARKRPRWITARQVVYSNALVVGARDLALSEEEAAVVLPQAERVREQARGWPALIGLAAATGTRDTFRARRPAELYEWIATELFASVTPEMHNALFKLALRADSTRYVARDVLGESYEALVARVIDHGFAIQGESGWISIHPLLRDFILQRLDDTVDAHATSAIVAEALIRHRRWDDCLATLDRFPDATLIARALAACQAELLASGRTVTLTSWVEMATRHEVDDPIVSLARAEVALRRGHHTEAIVLASSAARSLPKGLAARAHLAVARAAHQIDDLGLTLENVLAARQLADTDDIRREALWLAFSKSFELEPERTPELLSELQSLGDSSPQHAVRLACAEVFSSMGNNGPTTQALAAAERAAAVARGIRDPYFRTNALNLRAHLCWVSGEYAAAIESADELLDEARATGLDFAIPHALIAKAGALIGLRELRRAQEALREIDSLDVVPAYVAENAKIVKARGRIAAGDLNGAAIVMSQQPTPVTRGLYGEFVSFRALVAAARGRMDDSRKARRIASRARRYSWVAATLDMVDAITHAAAARDEKAADLVSLHVARGDRDIVVTACRAFPPLAEATVRAGADSILEDLLSASRDWDLGRRVGLRMPRERRRSQALSPRERDVYELLIQGRSNTDIAKTLYISASTAKVHVRHIYEKLGVHSRAEAAALSDLVC